MSFVINTTIDKNQELLNAYRELYESNDPKDVFLISKNTFVPVNSFALALSSDFLKTLLSENQRDTVNIIIDDVDPEILKKLVEYIYFGWISLDSKYMSDFIEACNLLQLKATISCERKLVFNKVQKTSCPAKFTSTPIRSNTAKENNLDSLIEDLETQEENVEYTLKQEADQESGQILEVYEISNIDDTENNYEMADENEDISEEQYELLNVVSEAKDEPLVMQSVLKTKKEKLDREPHDIKQRSPPKNPDEKIVNEAIKEILNNSSSFRTVSEKYQIPKTLLWRRAKKLGYVKSEKQKDPLRLQAIDAIKRGESLISLSKKFNIPISTLHREKLKLYEMGQLPESVNFKNRSRGEDYEDRLRVAIAEILNGKSQNEVAKKYNIPKTTIWRIIKKVNPEYKSAGQTLTPDSEIVENLIALSKKRSVKDKNYKDKFDDDEDDDDEKFNELS
ncbi:CLUMA_CG017535, isoform A [Clunio marinus]|uniref:CLUMA_CG017535, isoform A n=1 Tax=Clunio marinus TaxID=568069 RepID=A0A1J1IVZ8_9DIPT|nr:CLUMA_CG017535, isoform A [Clunio marinus]